MTSPVLLIACGALARELVTLRRHNDWPHLKIQCLPPELHNTPARIPGAVAETIERYRDSCRHIFVAYADCGTGGALDTMLDKYGVERLPGAHCYELLSGASIFRELSDAEPGTFFLTDFLVRHFERLVRTGLGLDRNPELMPQYFGNYKRVVYLAQTRSVELSARAREHAEFLGLDYTEHRTGLVSLDRALREQVVQWPN
jgi:hypothetical protein